MRSLEQIFKQNTGRIIHRYDHVLKVYDEYFSRFRGKAVNIMEIGIAHGGSVEMWKEYFGDKCMIYGVDVTDNTNGVACDQIKILLGDQGDPIFLQELMDTLPPMDIIIDDASHESDRQITCMNALIPLLKENGIYAIEDLHCAYRPLYHGGYKHPTSIIEYVKDFIDYFHLCDLPLATKQAMPAYFHWIYGVHFFRNVLLIDKFKSDGLAVSPLMTGEGTIPDEFHQLKGGRFDA